MASFRIAWLTDPRPPPTFSLWGQKLMLGSHFYRGPACRTCRRPCIFEPSRIIDAEIAKFQTFPSDPGISKKICIAHLPSPSVPQTQKKQAPPIRSVMSFLDGILQFYFFLFLIVIILVAALASGCGAAVAANRCVLDHSRHISTFDGQSTKQCIHCVCDRCGNAQRPTASLATVQDPADKQD